MDVRETLRKGPGFRTYARASSRRPASAALALRPGDSAVLGTVMRLSFNFSGTRRDYQIRRGLGNRKRNRNERRTQRAKWFISPDTARLYG